MTPEPPRVPPMAMVPRRRPRWPWLVLFALPVSCMLFTVVGMLAARASRVPSKAVLKLKLDGPMKDQGGDKLAELFGRSPLVMPEVLFALKKAAADKRIKAVWVQLDTPLLGWAQIEELRDALEELRRDSKKPVIVHGELYDEKTYALALGGDEILAVPDAPFEFNGLATEVLHYPGLLEKLGIEVQFFRYGKYKSVSGESFGRKALTEPVKEMINHTLDVEFALFVDAVAKARKLEPAQVKALIDETGLKAEWALDKKLIDGIAYADEVETKLKKVLELEEKDKLPVVTAQEYRRVSASEAGLDEGKTVFALIFSQGLIVAGKGSIDPFSGDESQGSTPIIKALKRAAEDDDVKAVVFRVNSPGGAGLGCDLVRREVERVAKKKPVVVSMSDYAASGGYWVAMNATAIVAEPSTSTGSIGIWSVVPNLKGTYEKLALNREGFARGAHADAINGSRPMTEAEAARFDAMLKDSYDRFVALAAAGRKKTHAQMEELAQGRTWLGQDAVQNGLVDKLGGLSTAVALAKEQANVTDNVKLQSFSGPPTLLQQLFEDDDGEELSAAAQALVAAVVAKGLPARLQHALPLSGVTHALLDRGETVFFVPEYDLELR